MLLTQFGMAEGSPDLRFLVGLNVATVLIVVIICGGILYVLQRRSFQRRLEEEKLVAVGSAMARILHQVKNPLQTVLLQAELLQDPVVAEDAALRREACRAILAESERLAAMLGELSVWASGARRSLTREPVALHVLLGQLAANHRHLARQVGVELQVGTLEQATVRADAFFLRQALENLLRNAREAVSGEPDGRVVVTLDRKDSLAVVRVADNGPGIPPDLLKQIFRPFVTTKTKGMGLGLSICKEIIDGHGGRIEVVSRRGAGAEFRVSLPLLSEPQPESDAPGERIPASAEQMLGNG